jgi:hypothetical protein
MNTLNDMNQTRVEWDCGTRGIGVVVSDSLMFERGDPNPSDPHLSHVYGLALPLLKHGIPVTPIQLENLIVPHYLDGFKILLLTYQGQKPLAPDVHGPLAQWVKRGGALIVVDDDSDPFNSVRDWWNTDGRNLATPRQHLFQQLRLGIDKESKTPDESPVKVGRGLTLWLRTSPSQLATSVDGASNLLSGVAGVAKRTGLPWKETSHLLLRRGPYIIAAGLDESILQSPKVLRGRFVDLFDSNLQVRNQVTVVPGSRSLLLDLDAVKEKEPRVIASACKTLTTKQHNNVLALTVEGVADTPAVVLIAGARAKPRSVTLSGAPIQECDYSGENHLVWVRFKNESTPRELVLNF